MYLKIILKNGMISHYHGVTKEQAIEILDKFFGETLSVSLTDHQLPRDEYTQRAVRKLGYTMGEICSINKSHALAYARKALIYDLKHNYYYTTQELASIVGRTPASINKALREVEQAFKSKNGPLWHTYQKLL